MGHFITFEGPEGSGKSTHIRLLTERLRERGQEVVITREPGGTPLCEAVRGLLQYNAGGESPVPRAEALLFCASRAQLVQTVVRPALERGAWVVSDRFADSTFAYQGYGRGFALDELRAVNDFATGGLKPALTLLLDLEIAIGRQRLAARQTQGTQADRFECEAVDFHTRLRQGFLELAEADPDRFRVIRTNREVAAVAVDVWDVVAQRFTAALDKK